MNFREGDLFESMSAIKVVTTCNVLRRDGSLVMGRGAAHDMVIKYPGADVLAGRAINNFARTCHKTSSGLFVYGFLLIDSAQGLGIFQTKDHFNKPARLDLIGHSAYMLAKFAKENPDKQIACNFPGIGFGELSRMEVQPILESVAIPDNVVFHTL